MILSGDLPSISPPAQRDRHDGQHLPHGAGKISDNYHFIIIIIHYHYNITIIYLTVLEKYQTIIIVVALIMCLCVIIIKLSGWEDID